MTKIKRNGAWLKVLQSEQLALPRGSTEISVEVAGLTFNLEFVGGGSENPRVETVQDTGSSATLRYHDFGNPLGTAFDAVVGIVNARSLILSILVHAISTGKNESDLPRLVSLTFFEGAMA